MKNLLILLLLGSIFSSCSRKQTVHKYRGYVPDTVQQVCYHCLAKKNGMVAKESAVSLQEAAVEGGSETVYERSVAVQKEHSRNYGVSGRKWKVGKGVVAIRTKVPILKKHKVFAHRASVLSRALLLVLSVISLLMAGICLVAGYFIKIIDIKPLIPVAWTLATIFAVIGIAFWGMAFLL